MIFGGQSQDAARAAVLKMRLTPWDHPTITLPRLVTFSIITHMYGKDGCIWWLAISNPNFHLSVEAPHSRPWEVKHLHSTSMKVSTQRGWMEVSSAGVVDVAICEDPRKYYHDVVTTLS
jgi:hypothetical protein